MCYFLLSGNTKTRYLSNASKYDIAGVVPWWTEIDSTRQLHYVISHPFTLIENFLRSVTLNDTDYFDGLFGKLGFNYVYVPGIAVIASFSSLVLGVSGAEVFVRNKKNRSEHSRHIFNRHRGLVWDALPNY